MFIQTLGLQACSFAPQPPDDLWGPSLLLKGKRRRPFFLSFLLWCTFWGCGSTSVTWVGRRVIRKVGLAGEKKFFFFFLFDCYSLVPAESRPRGTEETNARPFFWTSLLLGRTPLHSVSCFSGLPRGTRQRVERVYPRGWGIGSQMRGGPRC